MAHLLIIDADPTARQALHAALEPAGHVAEDAMSVRDAVELADHAEATSDPFDLVLVGPAIDPQALAQQLGAKRADHALVLVGHAAPYPAAVGSLEPGNALAGLQVALARHERYVGRRAGWEAAIAYLAAQPQQPQLELAAQRDHLARRQARLDEVLAATGPTEPEVMAALQHLEADASLALAGLPVRLEDMLTPLSSYLATPTFWASLRESYARERVSCYALLERLRRLAADRLAHGRVAASSHFELGVNGTQLVFFRWEDGCRVLEAFGAAAHRIETLARLEASPEGAIALVGSQAIAGNAAS